MSAAAKNKLVFFKPSAYSVRGWVSVLAAVVTLLAYFLDFSSTTIFLISIITFFAGGELFLRATLRELKKGYAGFNAFVTLCATGAFLFGILNNFSATALFSVTGAFLMLPFTFALANFIKAFELKSIGAAARFIDNLDNFIPKSAARVNGAEVKKVFTQEVAVGEFILIKVGERVPLDCKITAGSTMADENLLTGNITLTPKQKGDSLFAGSINKGREVTAQVISLRDNSKLAQVIEAVKESEKKKIFSSSILERYSCKMLIFFLILAAAQGFGGFYYSGFTRGSYWFMAFLFVLSVAGPITYMAAVLTPLKYLKQAAEKNRIFINNISAVKVLGECNKVFIDKTGTLTTARLEVAKIIPAQGVKEADLLKAAFTAQQGTNNIFSSAIAEYCSAQGIKGEKVTSCELYPSYGTMVKTARSVIYAGRKTWLESKGIKTDEYAEDLRKTVFYVSKNDKFLGCIYFTDRLRANVKDTVKYLKACGKELCLLSGDNNSALAEVAARAGIEEYYGDIYPQDKADKVNLGEGRLSAMIGDGFNDILAMLKADASIAFASTGENAFTGWVDFTVKSKDFISIKKIFEFEKRQQNITRENIYISVLFSLLTLHYVLGLNRTLTWYMLMGMVIFAILFIMLNSARLKNE